MGGGEGWGGGMVIDNEFETRIKLNHKLMVGDYRHVGFINF